MQLASIFWFLVNLAKVIASTSDSSQQPPLPGNAGDEPQDEQMDQQDGFWRKLFIKACKTQSNNFGNRVGQNQRESFYPFVELQQSLPRHIQSFSGRLGINENVSVQDSRHPHFPMLNNLSNYHDKKTLDWFSRFTPDNIHNMTDKDIDDVLDVCSKTGLGRSCFSNNVLQQSAVPSQVCDALRALRHMQGNRWKASWIQSWTSCTNEGFPFIHPSVFSRLTQSECPELNAVFLLKTTPKQLEAITPHCFAEFKWNTNEDPHTIVEFERFFRAVKPSMMSQLYKPLPSYFAKFLNGEQIKRVPPVQCRYLHLEESHNAVMRKVSSECLKNYLVERPVGKFPLNWNVLPRRVFSQIIREDVMERLTLEDWKVMPVDMFLLASKQLPQLCMLLGVEGIRGKHPIPPTYCIQYLSHEHILEILERQKSTLSSEYFGIITAGTVSEFPNGFDTLIDMNLKAHQWNALGDDVPDSEHPCSLITKPRQILDTKLLQAYMSLSCLHHIPCWSEFTTEQVDQLHSNIIGKMSYEHFELFGVAHVMKTMSRKRMESICEYSPTFSKKVRLDDWHLIPNEALLGVTPTCVYNLAILESLNEKDLQRLPDNAFESIGADDLHRIHNLPAIRPPQLANLGTKVPYERAPGRAIKELDFKELCSSRTHLLKMPLQVIGPMPELFCQYLDTPAKFSYLPPSSLIYMTSACLEYLPPNTYSGITITQAADISSGLDLNTLVDEIESPLYFLVVEKDSQHYTSIKSLKILLTRLQYAIKDYEAIHGPKARSASPQHPTNYMATLLITLGVANLITLMVLIIY